MSRRKGTTHRSAEKQLSIQFLWRSGRVRPLSKTDLGASKTDCDAGGRRFRVGRVFKRMAEKIGSGNRVVLIHLPP
jgi:hypothetical protein